MNREIKIPKTQYKEFYILIFSINWLFWITNWKMSPKISALLRKLRAPFCSSVMEFETKSSCQNLSRTPTKNQNFWFWNGGNPELAFPGNPFSFVIGILKASPLCAYVYNFLWYRNFKFWNPVDPNPKTLCHQACLRFGMRIAILFIAESLLAPTETLWPVLPWLMLKAFSSRLIGAKKEMWCPWQSPRMMRVSTW